MVAASAFEYVALPWPSPSLSSARFLFAKPHATDAVSASASATTLFVAGLADARDATLLFSALQPLGATHIQPHRTGRAALVVFGTAKEAKRVLSLDFLPQSGGGTSPSALASLVTEHEAAHFPPARHAELQADLDLFMAEFDNAEQNAKRERDAAVRAAATEPGDGGGWTVVTRRRKGAGKTDGDEEEEGDGWQLAAKSKNAVPLALAERLAAERRGAVAADGGEAASDADLAAAAAAAARAKKKRKKAAAELGLPSFYRFQNVKRLKEALRNDAVEAEGAAQRRDAARRAAERLARDDVV